MRKLTIIGLIAIATIFVSCTKDSADTRSLDSTVNGQAGSLAKMVTVDNYLYVINDQELIIFDITNPLAPQEQNTVNIGFGIETIFPFADHLFIGSVDGLYIYDITDPINPFMTTEEQVQHITGCDPVVANENFAYVTLNTLRNTCGNLIPANVLLTYDISDINNVYQVSSLDLTGPKGLGIDGDLLFICEASQGILVFDLSENPMQPSLMTTIPGFTANDVVLDNGLMMVVCEDGLRQFNYSDLENIELLSFLSTNE